MEAQNLVADILILQSSDQPGMQLVTAALDGTNYLSWSRAMVIALRAKNKLAFVDGRLEKPDPNAADFERWYKADSMVISWILNSMTKELASAFLYSTSAKNLWDEIKERYGESNGPLLYQLKREISSITQSNLSVAAYFTKLKKLWDELSCLRPLPACTCNAAAAHKKKQNTVSKSSAEAEYRSMSSTVCELQWISYLLRSFDISLQLPILLHCDNKAAEHIAANPVFHERTKHLDIDCHVVRNQILKGFIKTEHVASKNQLADLLTKPLGSAAHHRLLSKMKRLQDTGPDKSQTRDERERTELTE